MVSCSRNEVADALTATLLPYGAMHTLTKIRLDQPSSNPPVSRYFRSLKPAMKLLESRPKKTAKIRKVTYPTGDFRYVVTYLQNVTVS